MIHRQKNQQKVVPAMLYKNVLWGTANRRIRNTVQVYEQKSEQCCTEIYEISTVNKTEQAATMALWRFILCDSVDCLIWFDLCVISPKCTSLCYYTPINLTLLDHVWKVTWSPSIPLFIRSICSISISCIRILFSIFITYKCIFFQWNPSLIFTRSHRRVSHFW